MTTLCCLFEALFIKDGPDLNMDSNRLNSLIANTFLFSFVWSIGGNLVDKCMDMFDSFARELFAECHDIRVSTKRFEKLVFQDPLQDHLLDPLHDPLPTYIFDVFCSSNQQLEIFMDILLTLKQDAWNLGRRLFLHSNTHQRFVAVSC